MTDLAPIKTLIVHALNDSQRKANGVGFELESTGTIMRMDVDMRVFHGWQEWHATELATAINDHYATVLTNIHGDAIRQALTDALLTDKLVTVDERGRIFQGDRELKTDQMIHVFADRLIASLAGGSE